MEHRIREVARKVRKAVRLPLAVKLVALFYVASPYGDGAAHRRAWMAWCLFNRFYQPDIDLDLLSVVPQLQLSDSSELLLRLRWLAILVRAMTSASLACSGGVHTAADALKAIMAGAHAVQMVSALLKHGPELHQDSPART